MHTINVHHNYITKDLVKEASSRKIAIMSWFFIEESENIKEYKRLFKLGVDIICSNDPLLAKKYRDYYFNNFDYSNLIYPYYFI
jgi:glycerophosphoryl diester phosphodiesterase